MMETVTFPESVEMMIEVRMNHDFSGLPYINTQDLRFLRR
jgi:hypothetical protein